MSDNFPRLPEDLNIGKPLENLFMTDRIVGNISREEDAVEDLFPGPGVLTMHQDGIRVRNTRYDNYLDIHNSQISKLDILTLKETGVMKNAAGREALYVLLLILTFGLFFFVPVDDAYKSPRKGEEVYDVTYLVIHFWDTESRSQRTVNISGPLKKIQRFIMRWYEREVEN